MPLEVCRSWVVQVQKRTTMLFRVTRTHALPPASRSLKISWRRSWTNEQENKKCGPIALNWRKKLATVRVAHFLRKRRLKTESISFCWRWSGQTEFGRRTSLYYIYSILEWNHMLSYLKSFGFYATILLNSHDNCEKNDDSDSWRSFHWTRRHFNQFLVGASWSETPLL